MKYLFIIPRYGPVGGYYAPPTGIGYVISALKISGRDVESINMNEVDDLPKRLGKYSLASTVVLTGGLSGSYHALNDIISTARDAGFDTVLGGGILTAEPLFVYDFMKPTFGIIGEADEAIIKFAEALEAPNGHVRDHLLRTTPGIILREDQKTITTGPAQRIHDISVLPYPDHASIGIPRLLEIMNVLHEPYFNRNHEPRMVPIICSRGCPFRCTFCFSPIGKQYRQRSIDSIMGEVEYVIQTYKINTIMFLDELFANGQDRLDKFCEAIKKYNVSWICQLRVDACGEDTVKKLVAAGCSCVSLGIESMDDGVLSAMKKRTTAKQIETMLELCYKNGLGIQGNLIFGTPAETESSWAESVEWWKRHRQYMLNLAPAQTFPGSAMYGIGLASGKIKSREQFYNDGFPFLNTTRIPDLQYQATITDLTALQLTISEFTAKDVVVSDGGSDLKKRPLINYKYICPHCDKQVELKRLLKHHSTGRKTLRYACSNCNQRADFNAINLKEEA